MRGETQLVKGEGKGNASEYTRLTRGEGLEWWSPPLSEIDRAWWERELSLPAAEAASAGPLVWGGGRLGLSARNDVSTMLPLACWLEGGRSVEGGGDGDADFDFDFRDALVVWVFEVAGVGVGWSMSGKLGGMFPPCRLMTSRSSSSCLVTAMTRLRRFVNLMILWGRETGSWKSNAEGLELVVVVVLVDAEERNVGGLSGSAIVGMPFEGR